MIIEDLGVIEGYVYDIEVEDNHNFFANNILVHNSNYYHFEPLDLDLDTIDKDILAPFIEETINELTSVVNTRSNTLKMALDSKSSKGLFHTKKSYMIDENIVSYLDSHYDPSLIKISGLQLKSMIYTEAILTWLKELSTYIFNNDFTKFLNRYKEIREEFYISDYYKVTEIITVNFTNSTRPSRQLKASLFYNDFVGEDIIGTGNKVQIVPLIENEYGISSIAWLSSKEEDKVISDNFACFIDMDKLFSKTIKKNCELLLSYITLDISDLIKNYTNKKELLYWLNNHYDLNFNSLEEYNNGSYKGFIPDSTYTISVKDLIQLY